MVRPIAFLLLSCKRARYSRGVLLCPHTSSPLRTFSSSVSAKYVLPAPDGAPIRDTSPKGHQPACASDKASTRYSVGPSSSIGSSLLRATTSAPLMTFQIVDHL